MPRCMWKIKNRNRNGYWYAKMPNGSFISDNVLGSSNRRCSGNRKTLWPRDILLWPCGNRTPWYAASPRWIRNWPWTFSCWSRTATTTGCRCSRASGHREWRRSGTKLYQKRANWAGNSWRTRTGSIAIARPPAWWTGPASTAAEVSTRLPGRCCTRHSCTALSVWPSCTPTATTDATFSYWKNVGIFDDYKLI